MVQRCINMVTDISCAKSVKEQMFKSAIKDNGVYDTFAFCEGHILNDNTQLLQLNYIQVTYEDIANISEYHYKVIYFTDVDCFNGAKHIGEQYYDATVNKLKEDLVKDKNAIWSTISVNEFGSGDERRFEIRYKRANADTVKKSSEVDKMLTEPNTDIEHIEPKSCDTSDVSMDDRSKADKPVVPVKHTDSEICDISSVTNREGTTYKMSELVTYDKEYLYLPVHFGTVEYPGIFRIKIPLKTLKDALDQVE